MERAPLAKAALRPNPPAMLLTDSIADGKAQTRPLSYLLGGEKRVENASQILRSNSRAGIADLQMDSPLLMPCPHRQNSGAFLLPHGLLGIVDDVHDDLLELGSVRHGAR